MRLYAWPVLKAVDLIRLNESISYPELCSVLWDGLTAQWREEGREEKRMNVNENRKGGLHRLTAVILINTSNEIYQSINSFTFCVPYAAPCFHLFLYFLCLFFHFSLSLVAGEIDSGVVWFLESQSRVVIPESTETNRHFSGPRYPAVSVCHGVIITGTKVNGNDS